MRIKNKIKVQLRHFIDWYHRLEYGLYISHKIRSLKVPSLKLSRDEQLQIKALYSPFKFKVNKKTFEVYKAITGNFEPRYMPLVFLNEYIIPYFNDMRLAKAWADKAYYDKHFPELLFPHTVLRNINGHWYDHDYSLLSLEEAYLTIKEQKKFVVKPSIDSGAGHNVRFFNDCPSCESLLAICPNNSVVQEKICQHPIFAAFNESSVNIVRVMSFFWNDAIHILFASMRAGVPGFQVDNDGENWIHFAIDDNGSTSSVGYVGNTGKMVLNPAEILLKRTIVIPKFAEIVETVKKTHINIPYFALIGWDFTVTEDNRVLVMELNIESPGMSYQFECGPVFGEMTLPVLKEAYKRRMMLND